MVYFQRDFCCCKQHMAHNTIETINRLGFETLEHLPYNPDLAPSDMELLGCSAKRKMASRPIQKFLPGRHTGVCGLLDKVYCLMWRLH
ncbi:hypothetical protein NPIL_15341 [Nephila pilipes]|uniref:Histone-lysine N-methyltransferase SETMAR n=1 Tax=Nephila pilipes TaxID=299642 RepID=A0A8X6U831_NEPPI|nr:hypothetical protein NPIL_15341 [Nephila pilipes]